MNVIVVDFHARWSTPVVIIVKDPPSTKTIVGPADALRYLKHFAARPDKVFERTVDLCQDALLNGVDAEPSRLYFLSFCADQARI